MAKPPKFSKVDLPAYRNLMSAVEIAQNAISAVALLAADVKNDSEAQVEAHRSKMQAYLVRKDLRPHVIFKPLPNNNWAVAFNSETYSLGPYPNLDDIDEDDPMFWWREPSGVTHPAKSMFQALLGIVQDYCNAETKGGPTPPKDVHGG